MVGFESGLRAAGWRVPTVQHSIRTTGQDDYTTTSEVAALDMSPFISASHATKLAGHLATPSSLHDHSVWQDKS